MLQGKEDFRQEIVTTSQSILVGRFTWDFYTSAYRNAFLGIFMHLLTQMFQPLGKGVENTFPPPPPSESLYIIHPCLQYITLTRPEVSEGGPAITKLSSGPVVQWSSGQVVQWSNGQVVK